MKVYAVFVYCEVPGYFGRWIDTQWATAEKASERELELDRILGAFKVSHHKASVVELSVVDVSVVPKEESPQ
jgi:hypothetical protein